MFILYVSSYKLYKCRYMTLFKTIVSIESIYVIY